MVSLVMVRVEIQDQQLHGCTTSSAMTINPTWLVLVQPSALDVGPFGAAVAAPDDLVLRACHVVLPTLGAEAGIDVARLGKAT